MRNWKQEKIYCNGCGKWKSPIEHRRCPRGSKGSVIFLDIDNFEVGCNKCGKVWPLETGRFHCSCGNVQYTEYIDSEILLEVGDEIIEEDGDLVYILRESGEVVVCEREYLDVGVIY